MRFGRSQDDGGQAKHRQRGDHPEDNSPFEPTDDLSSNQWREYRRNAHNKKQQRKDSGGFAGFKQVPDHGARDNLSGAGAERLEEPQRNEHFYRSRERTSGGRDRE